MQSEMKPYSRKFKSSTLWLMAGIGLIIFILLQFIFPATSDNQQLEQSFKIITKEQAKESAIKFAESELKLDGNYENALVTYEARSEIYGYLSKENLLGSYTSSYSKQFPLEVFRVRFADPNEVLSALTIDVHMTTGQAVGFEEIVSSSNASKEMMLDLGTETTSSLLTWEGELSLDDKVALSAPYLKMFGFNSDQLELLTKDNGLGLKYQISGHSAGEAKGQLVFHYEYGNVSSVESYFSTPEAHTKYVKKQTTLANWLTFAGYGLFSFVLGILAIVYSALTRAHTSFKRGIVLSAIYFILSTVGTINMLPIFQKEDMNQVVLLLGLIFQGIVTLFMSASIYFSLVGGDGLWRKRGIILWSRSKEPGYGRHVLNSVWDGYAWALILLGIQAIIFFVLERTIHTWSTTDSTQSPYNMLYPILFPLLAWVAGIGEEAVYRLFGIPMLKKMFRSTFVASVITTLIWALGHTLYPIYPVISRPIELLFIGLIFSFIFLRYGFVTVVFAHVIFDSILMSFSLMFMGGTVNVLAGLFYIALPAIVAYIIYLFNPPSKERGSEATTPPYEYKKEEPLITTPHPEGH
ncbi:Sporulation-killing factor biosynthesis protein SkfC [compost metagenome]